MSTNKGECEGEIGGGSEDVGEGEDDGKREGKGESEDTGTIR